MSSQEASKSELNKHLDELLFRPSLNIQSGFFFFFAHTIHCLSVTFLAAMSKGYRGKQDHSGLILSLFMISGYSVT